MKRRMVIGLVTFAGLTLTLTACGSQGEKKEASKGAGETSTAFPLATTNKEKAIEDGHLDIANVSASDFPGIFSEAFSTTSIDSQFQAPAFESLFNVDENLKYVDGGAAKFAFDKDTKTVTITLNDGVKWSDGRDVTADDLIFPYEVVANKDYTGVRYNDGQKNIEGIEEYHAGKVDTISGIKKVNDKEITITFKELSPTILQSGGAVFSYAMPKHAFEGIAIKDMEGSDPIRKSPLSFGPYKVSKIQPGEAVEYTRNENYYGEKPSLASITMKKIPASSAIASIQSKEFDMYLNMPVDQYGQWKDAGDYEVLGQEAMAYSYLGFKLGKWDAEQGKNIMDPDAKMSDVALRQAMGYAIDNDSIGQELYQGLQKGANSLVVPGFASLHDDSLTGYKQDLDKANKLLDDAGYKDVTGDGIREDKDGKELKIKFAARNNSEVAQSLADYYIQAWKEIGLNVELTTGRLIETNSFYDKLQADDPDIDVYQAGWNTGYDPDQSGLYGETAQFNYPRYVDAENTELLGKMNSPEALDEKKSADIYKDWQKYAFEKAFVIPTTYSYDVVPVSKRVTGYTIQRDYNKNPYAEIGVTTEKR